MGRKTQGGNLERDDPVRMHQLQLIQLIHGLWQAGAGAAVVHVLIVELESGENDGRDEGIRPDVAGVEGVHSVESAEEKFARGAAEIGAGIELVALQSVAGVEVLEGQRARIEAAQTLVRAEPQPAVVVG